MRLVVHVDDEGTVSLGHFTIEEWRALAAMREQCLRVVTEYAELNKSADVATYFAARPEVKARLDFSAAASKRLLDALEGLAIPSEESLTALELELRQSMPQ